jgi:FkbM family methyltransferase
MHISWRKKLSRNPNTYRLLKMNLALNCLTHVTLHRSAVGDSGGVIKFTHNRLDSGNSRVCDSGETEVTLTTLDQALGADASVVDLLVMDTEGFESRAILPYRCGLLLNLLFTNDSQPRGLLLAEPLQ